MPPQSSTPTREKKASGCHAGAGTGTPTPTPSLRRVPVKPLGEHNRSRSHSPALGSLSVKDKRATPGQQKTGVDLTRRFADNAASRGAAADFRSPRGSPSLDRIQEGCSASAGRERKGSATALKSRLRGGGDDTPPVKKAITFSTPFGKEKSGVRKQEKLPRRKDLSEHFVLEVKNEDMAVAMSSLKPFVERHGGRDADHVSNLVEVSSKPPVLFSDLPTSRSIKLRGKGNNDKVSVMGARSSVHERLAMGVGHRSFSARSFAEDAPCRLAFDAIEVSPQGGVGAEVDVMLSPLPCTSPEVCNRGSVVGWECQEDTVAQEWFHSRDLACFESFSKGSKTPEPQPSKSPELSRRAIGLPGVGALLDGDRQEDVANQQTPSPQPTSSPEFLKRGSVPPSTGGCFGAGPLMGPEGMRSVKDRRKCKPRGILTIEGELLFSSGSADSVEEDVQRMSPISVPALASVEWMVAEGYDVEPTLDAPGCSRNRDASPQLVSPGSLTHLRDLDTAPGHRRCRSAVESGSDPIFWKKGLLYEWNLSLSDQKRAESPSPEDEPSASPVGKLREFSPEIITPGPSRLSNIMGSSLVIGALDTPSSCRGASDFAGEDEVESKYSHRGDEDSNHVGKALQELSLDGQAPYLSFSLDSSPESGESWQGIHTSQSTAWGDSQGEWGEYLRNNRYKVSNSQFRFHSSREEFTPAARALSGEVSPSTHSGGYADEGDSVVCTPSSTITSNSPLVHGRGSPYRVSWKKFCTVGKDDVGVAKHSDLISRDASPELVGISISISDAPSLDSSSDDLEVLRYHHSQAHPTLVEETKVPRGRVLLHEADYSPSSLLKADAFRASVSVPPRGC